MMPTRTCVVTVNYKGAKDTQDCIKSLQTSKVPVSIVVVDNSPHDPELEKMLTSYPEVKLIHAPDNLGFGRGNNLGFNWVLNNTDCEFIFVLNNDAIIQPDTIDKLQQVADNRLEAGLVTCRIVLTEHPEMLWYGGGEVDWKRGSGNAPGILGSSDAQLAMKGRYVSFASGCAMMIRTDVIRQTGGFDSRYFMYEEDLELCFRIIANGWLLWYEPSALVMHKGQGSIRKKQGGSFMGAWDPRNPNLQFYVYHIMRNRLLTMSKYAHGKNKFEFLAYFPFFILAKLFRFAKHGRWRAIIAMYKGWQAYRNEVRRT